MVVRFSPAAKNAKKNKIKKIKNKKKKKKFKRFNELPLPEEDLTSLKQPD